MKLPELGSPLTDEQIAFLELFAKSCRGSILKMVVGAQSGHPGGSLSSLDYLVLLYAMRVARTDEPVIVSHGHISPAVYSVLAELGVIPKERVIEKFRRPDDIYEGHVNRAICGVHYGTGPLGVGGSAGAGFAMADKISGRAWRAGHEGSDGRGELTFVLMGDGEQQEGQAYEMMNFAAGHELGNLVLFIDYNMVQLSDSLDAVMPTNIKGHYEASGWHVIEVDGHDFTAMWKAIAEAAAEKSRPSVIIGKTVMGKGVEFMEATGRELKADWHGKAPSADDATEALKKLVLSEEEKALLRDGLEVLNCKICDHEDASESVNEGEARSYEAGAKVACRDAYGAALLDLAKANENIVAMTADLAGSVKTDGVRKEIPNRHVECGIAEQHMISCAGGMSVRGMIPFASTFGAFMTSRAKDQARTNDLNKTNVKMVATHCGLSVGEDGPTHQAIDDISSFAGFMNTQILEPADANQCDRMIRTVAAKHGNFYVRMGRSKLPVITNEAGEPFFVGDYKFEPGKADILRKGTRATIVASGPMVAKALEAAEKLGGDIEVIAVSSFIPFDGASIVESAKKTGKIITVHDHNVHTGLACFVQRALINANLSVKVTNLGVYHYQLSGKDEELYELAGLSVQAIEKAVKSLD